MHIFFVNPLWEEEQLKVYWHNGKMLSKEARETWAEENPQAEDSNTGEETEGKAGKPKVEKSSANLTSN